MSYSDLVRKGRAAAKGQWTLGDLALNVETSYGKSKLHEFADDIGVEYRTLLDYRTVAGAYEKSGRPDYLTFGVAKAFAAQEDRYELVSKQEWTVREARALVAERKAAPIVVAPGRGATEPAGEPDCAEDEPDHEYSAACDAFTKFLRAYKKLLDAAEVCGDALALEGRPDLTSALHVSISVMNIVIEEVDGFLPEVTA